MILIVVLGAAVVLMAVAWQQGWFPFNNTDNTGGGTGGAGGAGGGPGDNTGGDTSNLQNIQRTNSDGNRTLSLPVRVAKQTGGTDNGPETEAETEAKANGNARGKHAVAGAAVRTSCTPSASSEKNIAANQCRGRGARYDMYGSIGTARDMVTDPQKRGILASNVAPYPQHTDEQPQDYQDLYKAVNGRQEPLLTQLLRGDSNPVPVERAVAAQTSMLAIPTQALQYANNVYSSE